MTQYKLSCDLYGHSLDVRGLATCNDSSIISVSRDASAKMWKPNGTNPGYHESVTMKGHTNFIMCVCVCPPTSEFPQGIILTSGNDKVICGFIEGRSEPILMLEDHTNAVCCLFPAIGMPSFLSSSWDATAKLWDLTKSSVVLTLRGHDAAVWSVIQLSPTVFVTASADKTIKLWSSKSGECEGTLYGHTDCVRGLAGLSGFEFLSCSNDATIRHWSTTGDCLGILYGHPNYIYSVSVLPDGNGFVSSGEDNVVLVWHEGKVSQSITLPAQSVWSVAVQSNGDIVTGSSDGVVRVFSKDPSRHAEEALQNKYNEEIEAVFKTSQKEIGGVKVNDLPGKEGLYEPGRSDGQTKMIRDGTRVVCYSWSAEKNEWTVIGDVVGSAPEKDDSGKTMYQGKAYDHVFSVDIQDGVPALKLPYNLAEDPWFAAQKFIHHNNLPQAYLEQVANFIVANSKKSNQPAPGPSNNTQPEFYDPFTGSSRYIPSAASTTRVNSDAPAHDPFTGNARYAPNRVVGLNGDKESKTPVCKAHFPQKSYLRFDQANLKVILEKLQELNRKTGDGAYQVEEGALEGVVKLADLQVAPDPNAIPVLRKLLEWPQDIVFPVLDVARLAVRNAEVNRILCEGSAGEQLMATLKSFLSAAVGTNVMLALRVVSNMFSQSTGEALALGHKDYLLAMLKDLRPPFTKPLEVALATVLLNLSVAFLEGSDSASDISGANNACGVLLPRLSDSEAQYRILVAFGTLWSTKSKDLFPVSTDLRIAIGQLVDAKEERVSTCAEQILELMN